MRTNHEKNHPAHDSSVDERRRRLLTGGSIATAAGLLWKPAKAGANQGDGQGQGSSLVFDVACFGDTFRGDFDATAMGLGLPDERRGATFFVEGAIYPQGVIPADVFDFEPADHMDSMIGHWLCRGWFMDHPGRPEPHVLTTQEYLLQVVTSEEPSPADTLVSSGVEGGIEVSHRAIVGGSGMYRHARGDLEQVVIGTNTTVLPSGAQAPNFRFYFDF